MMGWPNNAQPRNIRHNAMEIRQVECCAVERRVSNQPHDCRKSRPESAWQVLLLLVTRNLQYQDDMSQKLTNFGKLKGIRADIIALGADAGDYISEASPPFVASARNLIHYIGLRRHDLRAIQDSLAGLGLSSLGRAEGHVLANLDAVLDHLRRGRVRRRSPKTAAPKGKPRIKPGPSYADGQKLLDDHTRDLFGTCPTVVAFTSW